MSCQFCAVVPRNPCKTMDEVLDCPNTEEIVRAVARRIVYGPDVLYEDEVARLQTELDTFRDNRY